MAIQAAAYVIVARNWSLSPELLNTFATSGERLDPEAVAKGFFLFNNVFQLLLSLWFLYLVGFALEGWVGTPKFLGIYFASGLAGSFAKVGLAATVPEAGRLLGPSAGMLGVIGAAMYLLPHTRFDVWSAFGPMGRRGSGFTRMPGDPGPLSGLIGGHSSSNPFAPSREESWAPWAIGLYFIVLDFTLTWIAASPASYFAVAVGLPVGFILPWALRQEREDILVSDAMAVFSETRDLGLLSPSELQALYYSDPSNTTVLLNWMHKNLMSRWGVEPACMDAFRRNLPAVMDNEPPESVASVIIALNRHERNIESRFELYVGSLLEKRKHNQLAIDTYEAIRRSRDAAPDDVEVALFRLGMIYERQLFNPYGAAPFYRELIERFPLGPLAQQAKARLAVVSTRLTS